MPVGDYVWKEMKLLSVLNIKFCKVNFLHILYIKFYINKEEIIQGKKLWLIQGNKSWGLGYSTSLAGGFWNIS